MSKDELQDKIHDVISSINSAVWDLNRAVDEIDEIDESITDVNEDLWKLYEQCRDALLELNPDAKFSPKHYQYIIFSKDDIK